MRVTGGNARGHQLKVPSSVSDLRPSQDQVREAVFNILGGDIVGTDVLDLYAGTGAMGIEALSRGARICDFVEKNPEAVATIRQNLQSSDLQGKSDIYHDRVDTFLSRRHHQTYHFIFLDPPYADTPRNVILLVPKFLKENGVLIYLHGKRIVLMDQADRDWIGKQLKVTDNRKYGATHVSFMVKTPRS